MLKKFCLIQIVVLLFIIAGCSNASSGITKPEPIGSKSKDEGYKIGDVVYADGTSDSLITDPGKVLENKEKVIAFIIRETSEDEKALGVGIDFSVDGLSWCTESCLLSDDRSSPTICQFTVNEEEKTISYKNESYNGTKSGKDAFEGLRNRYNSKTVEQYLPDMPAFEYSYNYKNYCSRIVNTDYETGWFFIS